MTVPSVSPAQTSAPHSSLRCQSSRWCALPRSLKRPNIPLPPMAHPAQDCYLLPSWERLAPKKPIGSHYWSSAVGLFSTHYTEWSCKIINYIISSLAEWLSITFRIKLMVCTVACSPRDLSPASLSDSASAPTPFSPFSDQAHFLLGHLLKTLPLPSPSAPLLLTRVSTQTSPLPKAFSDTPS